ncbi:MAG: sensor histidine kinase, partial [Candidatus Binataceae bacterium]
MGLAAFIRANEGAIIAEWEAFARTYVPAAQNLDRAALRDHIAGLLLFIADDLETYQTERERREKAAGQGPAAAPAAAHGEERFRDGFDSVEMVSEFRALRSSVVKLWSTEEPKTTDCLPELIRFNEAIDQLMTESLARFTEKLDRSRSLFLGTLVHDLRNPLSAVHLSAHMLSVNGQLDDEQVKLVLQIQKSTSRIIHLVSGLIDVVRVDLGKGVPI